MAEIIRRLKKKDLLKVRKASRATHTHQGHDRLRQLHAKYAARWAQVHSDGCGADAVGRWMSEMMQFEDARMTDLLLAAVADVVRDAQSADAVRLAHLVLLDLISAPEAEAEAQAQAEQQSPLRVRCLEMLGSVQLQRPSAFCRVAVETKEAVVSMLSRDTTLGGLEVAAEVSDAVLLPALSLLCVVLYVSKSAAIASDVARLTVQLLRHAMARSALMAVSDT